MRRIIYLLVFFVGAMLALKPVWGVITSRPGTAAEAAQAAAGQAGSDRPRRKKQRPGRPFTGRACGRTAT